MHYPLCADSSSPAMDSRNSGRIPIIELPKVLAYLFEHPLILLKRRKYSARTALVRVFSLNLVCRHQIKFDRAFFVLLSSHPMKRR
jgi:hypothetical protein